MKKGVVVLTVTVLFCIVVAARVLAQDITLPRVSPAASVTQRIGITDIKIDYHRPSVRGRVIWGQVVPYGMAPGVPFGSGKPFPWRAGANDNTTISFTHEVKIEGKPLKAGTYGLHMIPGPEEWTIIFSFNSTAWGSFFYDEREDALRIVVKPRVAIHEESLRYGFDELEENSALAYLHWEKLLIPFRIEVATHKIVLENIKKELQSLPGFGWEGRHQAARYCLQNNIALDQGLEWINSSIERQKNFTNLSTKAQILTKMARADEASSVMSEALAIAREDELNNYAFQLLNQNRVHEAFDLLKENIKRYPNSWSAYNNLAEAFRRIGDNENAVKNYKTALKKAPQDKKAEIAAVLERLEASL
jgi:tetratricopeptide (TPR) repeat protein